MYPVLFPLKNPFLFFVKVNAKRGSTRISPPQLSPGLKALSSHERDVTQKKGGGVGGVIHPFCGFSYKRQLSLTLPLPFTPSHPQSRGRIPTYGRIPRRTSPTQPLPTRVFEEWAARNKWAHSYGAEWLHCFAAWPNVNKPEVAACRTQQEVARLDLPPKLGWMISSRKLFALGIHLDIILFIYVCTAA